MILETLMPVEVKNEVVQNLIVFKKYTENPSYGGMLQYIKDFGPQEALDPLYSVELEGIIIQSL